MKRGIVGVSAALLLATQLITSAPPASAGCVFGGGFISKCDGPVHPDGTWLRCVGVPRGVASGFSSHQVPERICNLMGPGQHVANPAIADPPVHLAD